MPTILVIEKTGNIKESNIKTWVETELYKKAGFKTADGFEKFHDWTVNGVTVSLYGKITGKAGQENKYDFPPPVDTTMFFGSCILTVENDSIKKSQWETIYEELFGGFEDIEDSDNETESDEDDELPRTKDGYVKDGFVVDEEEDEDEDEDDADDTIEIPVKTKKSVKSTKPKKKTVFEKIETEEANVFLDCTSELKEELYD
jgi:hypothetical protein